MANGFLVYLGLWYGFCAIITLPSGTLALRSGARYSRRGTPRVGDSTTIAAACTTFDPTHSNAPKTNIWHDLSDDMVSSVSSWLMSQHKLNLTVFDKAGEWDNTISFIGLMSPNKSAALAHLDHEAPAPIQYARVVLDIRATLEPTYTDIVVGPLPVGNDTLWRSLEYPLTRKTGGSVRNLDADFAAKDAFIMNITSNVADITIHLWGGFAKGQANDTLDVWGSDPPWQEGERVYSWLTFWYKGVDEYDGGSILPLGLFFKVDVTGRDASKWSLEGWLYNNIFYQTTEALRAHIFSPDSVRLEPVVDGDWTSTDRRGEPLPMDNLAAPTMVAPGGSRYSVDQEAKYVQWMDFSFYIGFSSDRGLALFDVRYRGERILYELGMQEALSHYAGNDPVQSGSGLLDTHFGFGSFAVQLVTGYDCPLHASYMNTSTFTRGRTQRQIDSICLFEYEAEYPIQRHSTSRHFSATKNIVFVVRSISTIANYDYMTSYYFHMDGSIKVEVRASGYIQPAFYAHNSEYGYRIHDALSGSMHDHVLNFKADFDILGTENSMELVSNVAVTESYPWSTEPRHTMKLRRRYLSTEDESQLLWDANAATQYNVVNRAITNKYGEHRGYRIVPASSTNHLTVQNSSVLSNAVNWASHDVYVTRYQSTEPCSTHPNNNQDVQNPPIDFAKFFNSESLDQEDLVVWFNLGMHHLPHTGDIPNTVFTTAHSSVFLSPVNFFEEGDLSRRTMSQVRVNYEHENRSQVEFFGQDIPKCVVDFEMQSEILREKLGNYTRVGM